MISKIGFQNIRVFKNLAEFELKSLTIFTGPNNSGKSVISKMFYLLKNGLRKGDLSKLYFTNKIIKEVGNYNENITRNSENESILFSIDTIDPFTSCKRGSKFHLEYIQAPKEIDLDYAILKNLKFECNNKVIFELKLQIFNDLIKSNEDVFIKIYNNYKERYILDKDQSTLKTYEEYLDKNFKNKIFYKKIFNDNTISNIISFLIDEVKSFEDSIRYFEENPNSISDREEICSLLPHYSNKVKDFHFPSYFAKLVLSETNFFNKKKKTSNSVYINYIKYTLSTNKIFNHTDFIIAYSQFERELTKLYLNKFFSIKPIKYKEISSDIFNINRNAKINSEDIEKINNPLAKLFLLEFEASNQDKKSETKLSPEFLSIIETFKKNIEGSLFGLNELFTHQFIFNNLKLDSLSIPSIRFYNQKQVIQEHYLESDKENITSSYYKFGKKFHKDEISNESKKFIDSWINKMGLGDKLIVRPIKVKNKIIGSSFYIKDGKNEYPLKDNGLGINKLIQILLEIASYKEIDYHKLNITDYLDHERDGRVSSNGILVIEEPESNLHPSFQSKLAEMFAEAINFFGINIMVETHSEYLIRKLQYLIADKDSRLRSDDISVYYLHDPKNIPEGEKQVYQLDIREDGFMNNDFGKGFFDEASSLSLGLFHLKNLN